MQPSMFPDLATAPTPRRAERGGRRAYTVQLLTPEYQHVAAVCARFGCTEAMAIELAIMVGVRELLKECRNA